MIVSKSQIKVTKEIFYIKCIVTEQKFVLLLGQQF